MCTFSIANNEWSPSLLNGNPIDYCAWTITSKAALQLSEIWLSEGEDFGTYDMLDTGRNSMELYELTEHHNQAMHLTKEGMTAHCMQEARSLCIKEDVK